MTDATLTAVQPDESIEMVERVVVFYLDDARYALPLEKVQEIQQIVAFSEVPGGGLGVLGLVNLRGAVIPAVDVRAIVGLPEREHTLETPMIMARVVGRGIVALVVDGVDDVVELPAGCMQAAPPMHALSSKMLGVCSIDGDLVYLLDVERLLGGVQTPQGA